MKYPISEVHPELQQIAKMLPAFTFNRKNLGFLRFLINLQPKPKNPKDTLVENIFIPSQDHIMPAVTNCGFSLKQISAICDRNGYKTQIRLRIYKPKSSAAPTPALIWLHGGGYILGKPEIDDPACLHYTQALGILTASVDYRCAPEHPFPAALEDGYSALQCLGSHAQQFGIDANRIAIGGESAGAGLAAALTQLAHDRKKIKPIFQLLIYPMLDDRTSIETASINNNLIWNQASNRFGWQAYLGEKYGAANLPPYSVPSRRANLTGLPPAWLGVGTLDLFYEETAAYAQRLKDSGVACQMDVIPGAFHGFDVLAPQTQLVQDFRKSQIAALKKHLFP